MKICIPTEDSRGMDARLCDHFGSAPCFTLFDIGSGRLDVLANVGKDHVSGSCDPTETIRPEEAKVVLCRGLGRRALERLRAIGVEVFVTQETVVRPALEAYIAGELDAMTLREACGGHGECDHRDRGKS